MVLRVQIQSGWMWRVGCAERCNVAIVVNFMNSVEIGVEMKDWDLFCALFAVVRFKNRLLGTNKPNLNKRGNSF